MARKSNGVVDDYLTSLLLDVAATEQPSGTPIQPIRTAQTVKVAHVQKGRELTVIWQEPLSAAQNVYRFLLLLSLTRTLPASRLRMSMLQAIRPL